MILGRLFCEQGEAAPSEGFRAQISPAAPRTPAFPFGSSVLPVRIDPFGRLARKLWIPAQLISADSDVSARGARLPLLALRALAVQASRDVALQEFDE